MPPPVLRRGKTPTRSEPKPKLDKEQMRQRIEKAYREGRMSEEQYLKNKEKFGSGTLNIA